MYKDPYLDYELYHYGVKGMRWGVRKKERQKRIAKKVLSSTIRYGDRKTASITKRKQKLESKQAKGKKDYKSKIDKTDDWLKKAIEDRHIYEKLLKDVDTDKLEAGKDYVAKSHLSSAIPFSILANIVTGLTGAGINVVPLQLWDRNVKFKDGYNIIDPSRI